VRHGKHLAKNRARVFQCGRIVIRASLVYGRDIVSLEAVQRPRDAFVAGGAPR
jgi:hypothetical protein